MSKESTRVYVGNLGNNGNKLEIEREFSKYGTVRDVWVARSPPGFAFVEFNDYRDAEDAVRELDGRRLCGIRVRVEISKNQGRTARQPPPFRGDSQDDDRDGRSHYDDHDCDNKYSKRSPRQRGRSPEGERSPRQRGRSPEGERSPRQRGRSPEGERRSPRQRGKSPEGERSPRQRGRSPEGERRSPRQRGKSPEGERRSPRQRGRSPEGERRSPRQRGRSPEGERYTRKSRSRSPRPIY